MISFFCVVFHIYELQFSVTFDVAIILFVQAIYCCLLIALLDRWLEKVIFRFGTREYLGIVDR